MTPINNISTEALKKKKKKKKTEKKKTEEKKTEEEKMKKMLDNVKINLLKLGAHLVSQVAENF